MTQFANIRAVTFDVGSTLIEPWPSVEHLNDEAGASKPAPVIFKAAVNL
ncbi:MAG: hypothetical protein AAB380_07995 [Verrucomicrobiota bacterium]